MKNSMLKIKDDYSKIVLALKNNKAKLKISEKSSHEYKKLVKKVIRDTIFVEGHSFCLDNSKERNKLSDIIFELLEDTKIL
ncbi:MAG: hypothetical protein H7Z37_18435 [Pyrinomonadaceae bacterium]|nr:hypothetical protein [Pyrinomonadaceae bacterium]